MKKIILLISLTVVLSIVVYIAILVKEKYDFSKPINLDVKSDWIIIR